MHLHASPTKLWAYSNMLLMTGITLFLFGYIFYRGAGTVSWEFLSQSPRGTALEEEGGIWPAIVGSLCFTVTAIALGGIPAVTTVLFVVFYHEERRTTGSIRMIIQYISEIPFIVLGLFAYNFLVWDLTWGCCILSSGVAPTMIILPFTEVRAGKAFRELPKQLAQSPYALGCSRFYTIRKVVLPARKGEVVSGVILGDCYAMGATVPLVLAGIVTYSSLPTWFTAPVMALPVHLYPLVAQGATSVSAAYRITSAMMTLTLFSSLLATIYTRRSQKKWSVS